MSSNDIEVKVGANSSDLESGMNEAANVIANSLRKIQSQFDGLQGMFSMLKGVIGGIGLGALASEAVQVMSSFEQLEIRMNSVMGSADAGKQAFDWIKQFAQDTPYEVDQVSEAFMRLKAFGLDPMNGTMKSVADMAAKLGGGQESLQRISLALGQAWAKQKLQGDEIMQLVEAGVPVWDMLATITGKNTAELQKLSEKGALGRDVIKGLITEMGRVADGAAIAQMQSLSGQWSNLTDNIKNGLDVLRQSGALDPLKEALTDLNNMFSEMKSDGTLQEWADNIATIIGRVAELFRSLLGVITSVVTEISNLWGDATNRFEESTGQQITAIGLLEGAIKGLETFFIALKTGIVVVMETIRAIVAEVVAAVIVNWINFKESVQIVVAAVAGWIDGLATTLQAFANVASHALQGDFDGAVAAWKSGLSAIENQVSASAARIKAISEQAAKDKAAVWNNAQTVVDDSTDRINKASQEGRDKIVNTWSPTVSNSPTPKASGSGGKASSGSASHVDVGNGDGKKSREKSMMGEWEAELAEAKTAYSMQNDLRSMDLTDEIGYWNKKLVLTDEGGKDRISIRRKVAQLELTEAKKAFQEQQQLDEVSIDNQLSKEMEILQIDQEAAQQKLDSEEMTNEQFLALQQQFEERRYQIEKEAQEHRVLLASKDPSRSTVELAKQNQKLETLERSHQQKMRQIQSQTQKALQAPGQNIFKSMQTSFQQSITGILTGAMTLRQGLSSIFSSIFSSFVTELVSKPVAEWLAGKARMLLSENSFFASLLGLRAASATADYTKNVSQIMANAAVAGSGAFAAIAAIPYVGPALAPVAAEAAYTGTASYAARVVPSASKGYDIPAGVNPLTQLHEKEMVLPAPYADVIRDMAGQNGGASGSNSSPQTVVQLKGITAGNFFVAARKDLEKALVMSRRDFAIR